MNSLNLTGRLVADPELRYTEDGRALCSMRIAVSGFAADETLFLPLVTFGSEAEACAKHLRKGRRVGFTGRLQNRPWDDAGKKRDSFSGIGHVEFLDSAPAQDDAALGESSQAPAVDAPATPRRRAAKSAR